jgi:hypothetical protein
MIRRTTNLLLVSALLALSACANMDTDPRLVPGTSQSADVLSTYGQPVRSWADADGGKTLEYSSQPFGQTCYMVKLAADGRVVRVENTLALAPRSRVVAGFTPEQVSRLLGTERSRTFFKLSAEEVWDWTVQPDQTGYGMRFNVHFKDGSVARTSYSMVFPDDGLLFGR